MVKAPLINHLTAAHRTALFSRLGEPLFDVALHDDIQNLLAVSNRLVDDFRIVLEMRYAGAHRFFYSLNKFLKLLI